MRCAVIDIGSNTIRLCLYHWDGQQIQTLFSKKETVGLAGYVTNGTLSQKGIQSCIHTLSAFQKLAQNFAPNTFCAFATASLRNIENTDQALQKIKEATGMDVDVILGREEARLDFVGCHPGRRHDRRPFGGHRRRLHRAGQLSKCSHALCHQHRRRVVKPVCQACGPVFPR